ncbi:unnamed protein product [Acanthosepion pharaonis]|uniref:Uncharacterized protein n=1 Tax=Acanthosepion pharaonis TaxID=158019 RepID=A0A812CNL0_ACAPH|nr:unnamed protein product [Sepia pharaonis]
MLSLFVISVVTDYVYKADKKAELQKLERVEQERQDREDELRSRVMEMRRRERERRHRELEEMERDRYSQKYSNSSDSDNWSHSRSPQYHSRRSRSWSPRWGPPGWGRARTSNPFLSSIRVRVVPFGVVHLSPARTGSSQVTRSSTAPKVPDYTTCPASQRSYLHWSHPASYFFTGDPSVFPGPFSFSVRGTSVLTRFIPSLRSPSAVYHRTLCLNSPQVVHLSESRGPDVHHTCKSNTPAGRGIVKPIMQIPGSPIGNCLSFPVLFHFFRVPYLDLLPVLPFHTLPPPRRFLPTPPLILSQSRSVFCFFFLLLLLPSLFLLMSKKTNIVRTLESFLVLLGPTGQNKCTPPPSDGRVIPTGLSLSQTPV